MFSLDKAQEVSFGLAHISDNLEVALRDEDHPIFYTGTNRIGNHVVGSIIDEDDTNENLIYFFHAILSPANMFRLRRGELPYREALKTSEALFVVQKDYWGKRVRTFATAYQDVPSDYLPRPSALYPKRATQSEMSYTVRLRGGIADLHKALVDPVVDITRSFTHLIDHAFDTLDYLKLNHQIKMEPFRAGSFQFRLDVSYNKSHGLFPVPKRVDDFVTSYLQYCLGDLSEDFAHQAKETNRVPEIPAELRSLESEQQSIFADLGVSEQSGEPAERLRDSLEKSLKVADRIGRSVGEGFSELEVSAPSEKADAATYPVTYLNEAQAIELTENYGTYMRFARSGQVASFGETTLEIMVFSLNVESRKGLAHVREKASVGKGGKANIFLLGDTDLTESRFTESLHRRQWITVQASGETIKGRIKKLKIFEGFKK